MHITLNRIPIEMEITMLTAFFAILLKILGTPALLAALMAFLQKTLHP
jgi:hypothetical protein